MECKVYLAFLVVSCTSLLPYNLFMNAHKYFYFKLRNVTYVDNSTDSLLNDLDLDIETTYQRQFEGFLTIFGGFACIIGAAINLFYTNSFSNTSRVLCGHFLVIISFIPTILYTYLNTDGDQATFFYVSLLLSSLANFGSMGLIAGGIMGLASTYPSVYLQTVMLGQSVAGIFSSVLSILCQAFASNDIANGRIYFVIAFAWTVLSVAVYLYLVTQSEKRNRAGAEYSRIRIDSDERRLLQEEDESIIAEDERTENPPTSNKQLYGMVFKQARLELLCVFLVLFVTLCGFPALASQVKSTANNETWKAYFSAFCCFLVFNVGDALGRLAGNTFQMPSRLLLYLCLLRSLFIPLIAICNVDPRYNTNTVVPYDGFFLLVMILFALSQGFTMTQSTVHVSSRVDSNLREVAGSMINVVCVSSALSGSLVGALLVGLV